jgi:hypothetical protein
MKLVYSMWCKQCYNYKRLTAQLLSKKLSTCFSLFYSWDDWPIAHFDAFLSRDSHKRATEMGCTDIYLTRMQWEI